MKGLLIKDMVLVSKQGKILLFFVAMALLNGYNLKTPTFMLFLLTFFSVNIAIQTVFFDQENKGIDYLLTLPITKKTYAIEKQILSLGMTLLSFVLGVFLAFLLKQNTSLTSENIILLLCFCLILSTLYSAIMVPLYLKYGSEKARLVIILAVLLIVGIGSIIHQAKKMNNQVLTNSMNFISELNSIYILLLSIIIVVLLIFISVGFSVKALDKPHK